MASSKPDTTTIEAPFASTILRKFEVSDCAEEWPEISLTFCREESFFTATFGSEYR